MVDPIGSVSQIGKILSTNDKSQHKPEKIEPSKSIDEVSISVEALELSTIEEIAKKAASELYDNKSATLSSNINKLRALA